MDMDKLRRMSESDLALLLTKNKDYGHDNLTAGGMSGLIVRMLDKIMRLRTLTTQDGEPNHESIEDTLRDLSNYGKLGRLLLDGDIKPGGNLVYLAGPIDDVGSEEAVAWRASATSRLTAGGLSIFDPSLAFTVAAGDYDVRRLGGKFIPINRGAIWNSDVVLANCLNERLFETVREIEFARKAGIPVVVALKSKSFGQHDLIVESSLEGAIERVIGLFGVVE